MIQFEGRESKVCKVYTYLKSNLYLSILPKTYIFSCWKIVSIFMSKSSEISLIPCITKITKSY